MPIYRDTSTGRFFFVNDPAPPQAAGFNPFQSQTAPPQQSSNILQQQPQQRSQQQSNPYSTYQNMMRLMGGGSTPTGMTPNAVNSMGEPYYGWGAQTGDWGATATPGAFDATTATGTGEASTSYLPMAGWIAAAIAGQHLMSGATDRRTMEGGRAGIDRGHRTGDVFSGDFFTEPWMAYGEQQLGIDTPTAGEKTDAAIDRMREGKGGFSDFASTIPATGYQWFDPVGNFAGDLMNDKFGNYGKVLTSLLLPHTALKWGADWLGNIF